MASTAPPAQGPAAGLEAVEQEDERRKVTRLIRFVALFVAVPTITIGLAFFLYTPTEHVFHMTAFLALGLAAVAVAVLAPRMAEKLSP